MYKGHTKNNAELTMKVGLYFVDQNYYTVLLLQLLPRAALAAVLAKRGST